MLEIVGDAIIIAFGIMSVLLFVGILTQGVVQIFEPNRGVLIGELILACLAVPFGIYHLIIDAKEKPEEKGEEK